MAAGTIALTNNSATVNGSGTSFTTELKTGDFVYVTVGGAPYTLVAANITSDTQMTLAVAFDGPTTSGLAWNAVPSSLQVAITQKILNDFASVARGRILDFQNWQAIYSNAASVTVTRPDRTQFTGPSWGYMADQYNNKANSSDVLRKDDNLKSLADKGTARSNLGVGSRSSVEFGSLELIADVPYIDFHTGSSTKDYTCRITNGPENTLNVTYGTSKGTGVLAINGGYLCRSGSGGGFSGNSFNYYFNSSSQMEVWVDESRLGAITLSAVSDRQLKKDIAYYDGQKSLSEVMQWKPATFKMKARGVIPESEEMLGFIANDLVEVSKDCVKGKGLGEVWDENAPENPYYLDQMAMIAKLTLALQQQNELISQRDNMIKELQSRMKAIDGLDA